MKQSFKRLSLSVLAAIIVVSAYAQVTTSSFGGHVSDKDGAVAGAAVVVVYQPTAETYYAVTDKNGNYRVNNVTPGGPYTVSVQMLGYRNVENRNMYAPLGETVFVDATLEDESVTLDAAVFVADGALSNMNIRRSGAGTSVSQRQMQALPTISRSMNDVMKLTSSRAPGLTGVTENASATG